jgi:hypothetical protein
MSTFLRHEMILPSNSGKRKTLVEAVVDMVTVDWADIVGGADTARWVVRAALECE